MPPLPCCCNRNCAVNIRFTRKTSIAAAATTTTASAKTAQKPVPFPLLLLPTDVIRRILSYADILTLRELSETNQYLSDEIQDDKLWRMLAINRFRVTPRVKQSRKLQALGSVNWKTLYVNWHLQSRIPVSKFSSPANHAFARGRGFQGGLCSWITVNSTDDCKLINSTLTLRVITQNIFKLSCIANYNNQVGIKIKNRNDIIYDFNSAIGNTCPDTKDYSIHVHDNSFLVNQNHHHFIDHSYCRLLRNDMHILFLKIKIPSAVFEIDALERIEYVQIPIIADGVQEVITCAMSERQIWDSYELLPGGWWTRVG